MDELRTRLDELKQQTFDAQEEVAAALELGDRNRQIALSEQVDVIGESYRQLLSEMAPGERDQVERDVGRKVTDLRRQAVQLTRRAAGSAAPRAVDAGRPFVELRAPGRELESKPEARPSGYGVGRDTEAWCSKCDGLREHRIVAMLQDVPKQVICLTCQTRHIFRMKPSPSRTKQPAAKKSTKTNVDVEAARRREAQDALLKELSSVDNPRWFDSKERFKVGEIIFHAEFGRGKIENVLRSSLLVRFRDGLRPLNLF